MSQGGLEIIYSRRSRNVLVVDGHKRRHVVGSNGAGSFCTELKANSDMFRLVSSKPGFNSYWGVSSQQGNSSCPIDI